MYTPSLDELIDELLRQGFRIRHGKHFVIYPPDKTKRICVLPQSTSDVRSIRNTVHDLRKFAGFIPPHT